MKEPGAKRPVAVKRATMLPRFKDDREAAAFWDSHSIAPYWHLLKPVKVTLRRPVRHFVRLADGRRIPLAEFERMKSGGTKFERQRAGARGTKSITRRKTQ